MGVRLDWQVEAERLHNQTGEDPNARRKRWRVRLRMLILIGVVGGMLLAAGGALIVRLNYVDDRLRTDLSDTVTAEITALRLGDFVAYMNVQRSAAESWYTIQSDRFYRYREMLASGTLQLPGIVRSMELDWNRARVVVEETYNGIPHETVWFYWRYPDGWQHVPSDYTFWGQAEVRSGTHTTVSYQALDSRLGEALAKRADIWWAQGCTLLTLSCDSGDSGDPPLRIRIVPDPVAALAWDSAEPNTLIVPSPLAIFDRARADLDIPTALETEIALQLASGLLNRVNPGWRDPNPAADAAWLRGALAEWLAGQFTGRGDVTRTAFMQGLRDAYGETVLPALARALTPESTVSLIGQILNQPVEMLVVDWRGFFQWRLDIEKTLLARGDRDTLIALWDTTSQEALTLLQTRLANPVQATAQVSAVTLTRDADGVARAVVQVTTDGAPAVVQFRLLGGMWRRTA